MLQLFVARFRGGASRRYCNVACLLQLDCSGLAGYDKSAGISPAAVEFAFLHCSFPPLCVARLKLTLNLSGEFL
jgi:hypothetical protein